MKGKWCLFDQDANHRHLAKPLTAAAALFRRPGAGRVPELPHADVPSGHPVPHDRRARRRRGDRARFGRVEPDPVGDQPGRLGPVSRRQRTRRGGRREHALARGGVRHAAQHVCAPIAVDLEELAASPHGQQAAAQAAVRKRRPQRAPRPAFGRVWGKRAGGGVAGRAGAIGERSSRSECLGQAIGRPAFGTLSVVAQRKGCREHGLPQRSPQGSRS